MHALLAAAWLALPARASKLAEPAYAEADRKEALAALKKQNGADARGCMTETEFYRAFAKVGGGGAAWNPDNPVAWYFGRNTVGLAESLIVAGYASASQTWTRAVDGTDFRALAKRCLDARSPRALAACLDGAVRESIAASGRHAALGGDCKMYAATLVATATELTPVTKQAAVVSGPAHAINEVSIRDSAGRDHVFFIDALNDLVVAKAGEVGQCLPEGELADVALTAPEGSPPSRANSADWQGTQERIQAATASPF